MSVSFTIRLIFFLGFGLRLPMRKRKLRESFLSTHQIIAQEDTMTRKALKLFQLFLEIFVVYSILKGQLFLPLLCLVIIFLIGRYGPASTTSSTEKAVEAKAKLA